jgi:hypothetical protein
MVTAAPAVMMATTAPMAVTLTVAAPDLDDGREIADPSMPRSILIEGGFEASRQSRRGRIIRGVADRAGCAGGAAGRYAGLPMAGRSGFHRPSRNLRRSRISLIPSHRLRHGFSGVLIHFCRAVRRGENGQPSLRARPRTEAWRRFKAAEARTTDALWATRVFSRSSSSGVHGLDIGGISVAEDHHANRKDGGADPDKNGGLLLGNGWLRFHDQINRNVVIGFRGAEPGPAFSMPPTILIDIGLEAGPQPRRD